MCNLHRLIVYQPFAHLTCECQKKVHDVFVVVNFISSDLEVKHVTIWLGECTIEWLNINKKYIPRKSIQDSLKLFK